MFFFSTKMGGFHQAYRCTYARVLTDMLVQKNFFFGQLLYTSAVAMVTQVCDPAEAQDWLEKGQGSGKQEDFVGGVQRGTRRGPDTKIIRATHNSSYKCHFIY